uniref:Venom S1 protease 6 n=1 Tax=Ectomocoris sp. TaxID=3104572 RepID=A0AB38ZE65_9HEMI
MLVGGSYGGYLVIFSLIFGFASTIDLNVKDDGKNVFLQPNVGQGRIETQWNIRTCKGCKLVLGCAFKTNTCKGATIKVDVGGKFSQHCPDPDWMTFFNTSNKDFMSVTIENVGPSVLAFCQVKSTIAYIDLPEEIIDSSEFGLEKLKNKSPTTCRCGWSNKSPKRIVGGREATVNEYPFIALIMEKKTRFPFCGGSIITKRHVLTAAHCTFPNKDVELSVVLGEHDVTTWKETSATEVIDVKQMFNHPQYNQDNVQNDIAIVELVKDIVFNNLIGPVCMPKKPIDLVDTYLRVMGWGLTKDGGQASSILRKVDVKIINPKVCEVIYGTVPTQICAYNNQKDSCQGDSGGPLVIINEDTNMFVQEAVVSFGRECASTDPGVNTKLSAYMDWVKQQVKGYELCY